jgi:hypothetical protein
MRLACVLFVVACHGGAGGDRTLLALHTACAADQRWSGSACVATGDGPAKIEVGKKAIADLQIDAAKSAFDAAELAGPLAHDANVTLWEQRGIAAAYVDDEATASTDFDMLLALDPSHFLSYFVSPKATFVFEKVRNQTKSRPAPAIDVSWMHDGKVGDPVPVGIEVLADPKQFLRKATLFVRTRGEPGWRAAELELPAIGSEHRLVLPPVVAEKPISLELYLRAYDAKGNEVLTWADPARPREIPLRFEPPPPWYRKWWVLTLAGSAAVIATGITVYELTISPPDKIGGSVGTAR